MSDTLLATKLHIPPTRLNLVLRTRLTEQLERGAQGKLTLVSAPAGFGKTTMVSDWARNRDRPVAWVSLDEADNDPVRFLDYLVSALQGFLKQEIVTPDLTTLQSPIEPVLSMLINEAAHASHDIILVLDDYYLIQEQAVHQALTFLLEHQPSTMHLIIISRDVPPLSLARLRLHDQLTELEAADLRFTTEEATAFLNQVMGLELTTEEVATLEARTEGWIAGLQAAALSMRGRQDTSAFIQAFSGSHRYILDYLVEEVLQQQPERIQHFLLQTSILDRMSAPLCTAVTGQEDAQATLEMLEGANLFIIPLDDHRHWYRYHRLFADFLRNRLQQTQGNRVSALHSAAAKWYAQADLTTEAVNHSLAAGEFDWAVGQMEGRIRSMIGRGQMVMLTNWLESLPADLVNTRPQLSLAYGFVLLFRGQLDAIEPYLQNIENTLPATALSEIGDSTPSERHAKSMLVQVVALRALIACLRGEVYKAIELSRQALDHLPANDLFMRGIMVSNIAVNLTDNYGSSDEWALAIRALREAAQVSQEMGHSSSALSVLNLLGEFEFGRGKLHQAEEVYLRAIGLVDARRQSEKLLARMVGVSYIGLARLLYEWNELDRTVLYLEDGLKLLAQDGDWNERALGTLLRARAQQARGDSEQAQATLYEAERLAAMTTEAWIKAKLAATRVHFWLIQGQLEAAAAWAEVSGLSEGDQIGWRREDEYFALARVRIAQGQAGQALVLLTWLSATVESAGMMRSLVKSLALQALALEATGDSSGATTNLERALALAEPEGYVRTFVDLGSPMMDLLQTAFRNGILPGYSRKLLEAFGEQIPSQAAPTAARPQLEPLTARELEVLALVAAGQSNQEIARLLFITVGTVKRHVHNICGKLGVRNRTQAASRARELGLL